MSSRLTPSLLRAINAGSLIACIAWVLLVSTTLAPETDDFKQYWQAIRNLWQTGDPYTFAPASGVHSPTSGAMGYYYPPLFVYLVQPIALLSQIQGQVAWYWLNCAALAGLIVLCIGVSGSAIARRYWGVVALAVCLAPPTRLTLQLGQISILVALLLIGSFALAWRNSPLAGLLLSVAALVRVYPALLGVYFLLRQPRGVIWWAAAAGLGLLGGSLLIYGPRPYQSFITQVLFAKEYPYLAEHNISLFGFFGRMFTPGPYAVPVAALPALGRLLAAAGSLAVLALCFWAGYNPKSEIQNSQWYMGLQSQLQFGLWLCATMLLSTTNGYYTLVLVLLPCLALLRALEECPDRNLRAGLILATALTCLPPGWGTVAPALDELLHTGWGLLLLTPSLYGLLIYLALLAYAARRGEQERITLS